jgi:hypothetical protein
MVNDLANKDKRRSCKLQATRGQIYCELVLSIKKPPAFACFSLVALPLGAFTCFFRHNDHTHANSFSSHAVDMSYQHISEFGTNFALLFVTNLKI